MLGASAGTRERVALGYDYHPTANNGNLQSHVIRYDVGAFDETQKFRYDSLNQLEFVGEYYGACHRSFAYDRYGNRWIVLSHNISFDTYEPRDGTVFDIATNRMTTSTVAYDAAGNQTLYSPHTLAYDAENRLKSMTHASSGSGTYLYDGEGRRVKKTWTPGGGTAANTYYVYHIAGNLAAEYGTGTAPASGTLYPFTDMLGSVRAVTDAAGTVVECYDYLPFGRMLSASDNGRTTLSCHPSSPDSSLDSKTSQKFTGQVRDGESRLDYFRARYMSGPQGRFLSADDPFADQWESEPQSWNLYAYVRNNPLSFVDPTGRECTNVFHEDGHLETTCHVTADVLDRSVLELFWFVLSRRVPHSVTAVVTTAPRLVEEFVSAPRNPGCMLLASGIGVTAGTHVGATIGGAGGFVAGAGVASIATTPAGVVGDGLVGAPIGGAVGAAGGTLLCAQMSGSGGGPRTGRKLNPDRAESARQKIERLRAELVSLRRTANKTPALRKEIARVEAQIRRARGNLRPSEEHARTGQR